MGNRSWLCNDSSQVRPRWRRSLGGVHLSINISLREGPETVMIGSVCDWNCGANN